MHQVENLKKAISAATQSLAPTYAISMEKGVPIYDCAALASHVDNEEKRASLKAELAETMLRGPGVFVLKGAFQDTSAIDQATTAFLNIIEDEKKTKASGADHFAASGANDRIWNSLEKLCLSEPQIFAKYHSNAWIDLAAEAWLGPCYQTTAQVNLVRPGGAAQEAHCDYHLGFMSAEQVRSYPAHIHATSAQLTLQGAVAHCDMPVESGTTKLLPGSQTWTDNYSNFRDPEIRAYFEENHVQLPLSKGDLLFFSPGMLHAAGANTTADINRMANLLQISSAFGISLETIDRVAMCKRLYPVIQNSDLSQTEKTTAVASTAEGYPFPTNLDKDPPVGGLAPPSQQKLFHKALSEDWSPEKFNKELDKREACRVS